MAEGTAVERIVEALLFLSPKPLSVAELAEVAEVPEEEVGAALSRLQDRYAPGRRGIQLREIGGGFTFATDPVADPAARRLFGRQRRASLAPAQLETLAIIAYLQPISRSEIARIRGVSADSAVAALLERELIEEAGRSPAGATLYRTSELFLRRFGLRSLGELPDPRRYDPSPDELASLRERLLRAGDLRSGATPPLEGAENGHPSG